MIGETLGIASYTEGDLVKIYAFRKGERNFIFSKHFVGKEKYAMWVVYINQTFYWRCEWEAYTLEGEKVNVTLKHEDIHGVRYGEAREAAKLIRDDLESRGKSPVTRFTN